MLNILRINSNSAVQSAAKSAAKDALSQSLNPASDPSSAPTWAQATPVNDIERQSAGGGGDSKSEEFTGMNPEDYKSMTRWHLALRLLYMSAAIFMSAAAVLSLVAQTDVGLAFFALYVFAFSILICCFEVALSVRMRPRVKTFS